MHRPAGRRHRDHIPYRIVAMDDGLPVCAELLHHPTDRVRRVDLHLIERIGDALQKPVWPAGARHPSRALRDRLQSVAPSPCSYASPVEDHPHHPETGDGLRCLPGARPRCPPPRRRAPARRSAASASHRRDTARARGRASAVTPSARRSLTFGTPADPVNLCVGPRRRPSWPRRPSDHQPRSE